MAPRIFLDGFSLRVLAVMTKDLVQTFEAIQAGTDEGRIGLCDTAYTLKQVLIHAQNRPGKEYRKFRAMLGQPTVDKIAAMGWGWEI